MFTTASLARRIEMAEAALVRDGAEGAMRRLAPGQGIVRPLAGGIAAFVEPGAPFNKVAGLGFAGLPDPRELDRLEADLGERGYPVQVELSSLADPAVGRLLTARGYRLAGFENVLGLALAEWRADDRPSEVTVAGATDGESGAWMRAVIDGFLHPDVFDGPPSHESFGAQALERVYGDTIAAHGFERYIARRAGEIAGGASLKVHDGVAQLCGAATLPGHRRKGVQSALLRHRLEAAGARGCDVATVTTQPASKSQQNVQRFGFALLYVRAVLVKE